MFTLQRGGLKFILIISSFALSPLLFVLGNWAFTRDSDQARPRDTKYLMTLYRADYEPGMDIYKGWVVDGDTVLRHVSDNLIYLYDRTDKGFITTGVLVIEGIR